MKKIIILFFILFTFFIISAEDFDEYSFMKKVNPDITQRTSRIIKESIDANIHLVSNILSKKQIYMLIANESRFKEQAVGINPDGTKDKGLFQINKSTYYSMVQHGIICDEWNKIYNVKYNIKIGMKIIYIKNNYIRKLIKNIDEEKISLMVLIAFLNSVSLRNIFLVLSGITP